ncbi:hypothetical protein E2562_003457 [Oryza meyeriana var. granulata]|uniref:Uncharacterized protein n=1 Tax=Oryza meyeriana var. granulata TaxID=110450 RepID=A0A6G1CLX2_9ORYZ|nr:hypothetical protein E2562_003457 [Oryza meyeriana var. granulata]
MAIKCCGDLMDTMDHLPMDAYVKFNSSKVEVMVTDRNVVGEAGRRSNSIGVDANSGEIVIGLR